MNGGKFIRRAEIFERRKIHSAEEKFFSGGKFIRRREIFFERRKIHSEG